MKTILMCNVLIAVLVGVGGGLVLLTLAVIAWAFQVSVLYGLVALVAIETLPLVIVVAYIAHLLGAL